MNAERVLMPSLGYLQHVQHVDHVSSTTIATWVCVCLVVLVLVGVMRALVKPLVAIALVAILMVALGLISSDTVAHAAREIVHRTHQFVSSFFSAAEGH